MNCKSCCRKSESGRREKISPNTLRYYFVQKRFQLGMDIYSLSRLLRHEDISITKRYLQSLDDVRIIKTAIKKSPLMTI
jgi:integrase/recombinase XerD